MGMAIPGDSWDDGYLRPDLQMPITAFPSL